MKFKIAFLFGVFVFLGFETYAQLDTKHWVPPFYAKPGPGSGTTNLRKHFVSLSTPTTDTIPVTIRDGFGEVVAVVEISRDMPKEYTFQPLGNANTDTYPLNVIPTDSLNIPIRSQGLYFESYQPFFVNMRHKAGSQGFSLTTKGQVGLGSRFYSGHLFTTYNTTEQGDEWNNNRRSHFIAVMATEDNTTITFDMLKTPIEFIGHPGAESVTITLDAMESYVVGIDHGQYDNSTINLANGIRITSDREIITNTGSWLSGNMYGQCIGADQIVPAHNTGQEYVVVRGLGDQSTERPMVVATENNTEVYLNADLTPAAVLDEGEFLMIMPDQFTLNNNLYVRTTKNAYMYQTLSGSATQPGPTVGLIFIPPLNCVGAKRVVLPFVNSLSGGTGQGQINVITKAGTSIYVNESETPITGSNIVIGNSDWVTYSFVPPSENVIIESDSVMNVALATRDNVVGSAGYFSGFTVEPVVGLSTGYPGTSPCVPGNALLQVYGFDTYQWYFNGEPIPGEEGSSILPQFSGSYTVEGIDLACGYRFMSNEFAIPFCPSTMGVAKDDMVVEETEPGSKVFDITYRLFMENFSNGVGQNLQVVENLQWGLPVGATVELIGEPTLVFGVVSGGINPDFDGVNDHRIFPGNGSLSGFGVDAVDLTVRVDMNEAEQDGYINQVVVSTKDIGTNDGETGPFSSQDFSHHGTNPDPNGNGEPNEEGENTPTLTCFFTNEISYGQMEFCDVETVQEVTQDGINAGEFTADVAGLWLDSLTGAMNPSLSEPGTYTVTLTTGGRCPTVTTTEVVIVENLSSGEAAESPAFCLNGEPEDLFDYLIGADPSGNWFFENGDALTGNFIPDEPGAFTMSYTVENGLCGDKTTTLIVTVVEPAQPGEAVDNPMMCISSEALDLFSLLEDADAGGVWTDGGGAAISGIFSPTSTGTFDFTYTVMNDACGAISTTFTLTVEDLPDAGIALEVDNYCPGDTIYLFDLLLGGEPLGLWLDADGAAADSVFVAGESGNYEYAYVVEGVACDPDTTWVGFEIQDADSPGSAPEEEITLCPDDPVLGLYSLLIDADPGGVWTRGDGSVMPNGLFDPEREGTFSFVYTVTDDYCGESETELEIKVTYEACIVPGLLIPEGFSPNGDGIGDYWIIRGLQDYPNNKLLIFNRWGNEVFSASPYQNNWDGRARSGMNTSEILPVGTYWYILETGEGEEPRTGYIYLNR